MIFSLWILCNLDLDRVTLKTSRSATTSCTAKPCTTQWAPRHRETTPLYYSLSSISRSTLHDDLQRDLGVVLNEGHDSGDLDITPFKISQRMHEIYIGHYMSACLTLTFNVVFVQGHCVIWPWDISIFTWYCNIYWVMSFEKKTC